MPRQDDGEQAAGGTNRRSPGTCAAPQRGAHGDGKQSRETKDPPASETVPTMHRRPSHDAGLSVGLAGPAPLASARKKLCSTPVQSNIYFTCGAKRRRVQILVGLDRSYSLRVSPARRSAA